MYENHNHSYDGIHLEFHDLRTISSLGVMTLDEELRNPKTYLHPKNNIDRIID